MRSSEKFRHVVDAERPSLVLEDFEGMPENRPEDHPLDLDGESVNLEKFIIEAFQCFRSTTVAIKASADGVNVKPRPRASRT